MVKNMTQYFNEEELNSAEKELKKVRNTIIFVFIMYVIVAVIMVVAFANLPYKDKKGIVIEIVLMLLSAFYIVLIYITWGIKYKRAKKYVIMYRDLKTLEKTETIGTFKEYSSVLETRDGVDQKAIIISVYVPRRQMEFDRAVYVPFENEFPEFTVGDKVKFYTTANNLYGYEILEKATPDLIEEPTKPTEEPTETINNA